MYKARQFCSPICHFEAVVAEVELIVESDSKVLSVVKFDKKYPPRE